jgi:uncharacterized protein YaiI (UPF0178 family)
MIDEFNDKAIPASDNLRDFTYKSLVVTEDIHYATEAVGEALEKHLNRRGFRHILYLIYMLLGVDPEPTLSSYKDYWIQYYREIIDKIEGYRHDAISLEKQMSDLSSSLRKIQTATEHEKKYQEDARERWFIMLSRLSSSSVDKHLTQLKEISDTRHTGFHMVSQVKYGLNELVRHSETMIARLQAGGSARTSLTPKAQIERIKSSQEMMKLAIQKHRLKEPSRRRSMRRLRKRYMWGRVMN